MTFKASQLGGGVRQIIRKHFNKVRDGAGTGEEASYIDIDISSTPVLDADKCSVRVDGVFTVYSRPTVNGADVAYSYMCSGKVAEDGNSIRVMCNYSNATYFFSGSVEVIEFY